MYNNGKTISITTLVLDERIKFFETGHFFTFVGIIGTQTVSLFPAHKLLRAKETTRVNFTKFGSRYVNKV